MSMLSLAYTPLWEPITALYPEFDRYWLVLIVPLVIGVCLVYKGTRVRDQRDLPKAVAIMVVQVFVVMVVAAAVIYGVYMGLIHRSVL